MDKLEPHSPSTQDTGSSPQITEVQELEICDVPVNNWYLLPWSILLACASSVQSGYVIGENGQVGFILAEKLGWNQSGNTAVLNTIMTVIGCLGLAFGSVSGGIIGAKFGVRKVLICGNFLNFLFCATKLIENTVAIMASRFLFGFCSGVLQFCFSKALNDTVPINVSQTYSLFVNSGICLGIFLSNALGFFIPAPDENDMQVLKDDQYWRLVFGFPMVLQVLSVILITRCIPHLSLRSLLSDNEKKDEAIKLISRIYKHDKPQELYHTLKSEQSACNSYIPLKQALTDRKYRRATWTCLLLTPIQQFTGISAICLFQTTLFLDMKKRGEFNLPIILAVNLNNLFNFLSSLTSGFPQEKFGQKKTLVITHCLMVVFLFGVVIFTEMRNSQMTILMMLLFIFAFQSGIGPITFQHIQETCVDSALGLANQLLFTFVIVTSVLAPIMVNNFGAVGCFTLFGSVTLLDLLFVVFMVKDTSYGLRDGKRVHLTEKQKKQLYMPLELREEKENTIY